MIDSRLMALRFPPSRFLLLPGVALLAAGQAVAQLAAKSPFLPPQAVATNAPTVGAPLEFRGYIETGDGVQFRVYDPAKKAGAWVKLNERNTELDLVAKEHDVGQKALVVEYQGKKITLAEREAKVVSAGNAGPGIAPPPVQPPPGPTNVAPAVTQSVVLNPTPADEQRRLEAVASEVARRRAMREQATQQISQGAPPPVPVPPQYQPQSPVGNLPQNAPGGPQNFNSGRGPGPSNRPR